MEERLSHANDLREKEQYGDSSKEYTQCLIDLVSQNDPVGLIHCLGGQSLIYKNLLTVKDSPLYRQLVLHFAKEGLTVADQNPTLDGKILAVAYRCFGDALAVNRDFSGALPYFEKALDITTVGLPEKGYLKTHIGGLQYQLGEKEKGLATIDQGLADIRTGDMNAYAIRVWETGALNGLSKIYALEGQKEKALGLINESLKISTDHNLSIRKREAEEILDKISNDKTDYSV